MLSLTIRCSIAAALLASAAHAGTMLQPAAASTNMGWFNTYEPFRTINQSGLAATYTSGVTDFATFASTTGTVNGGSSFTGWYSQANTTTGNFDFDLGGTFAIDGFALWNDPQASPNQGVNSFTLLADDNAAFSSPVNLGTFSAVDGIPNATNFGQQFSFAATSASHVRMVINSNHGSTLTTGFVEAAFSQVPSPAGLALLGPAALLATRRRRGV
jgi:hypothetical protein